MNFPQPRLSVCKTIGNFFRVQIYGPDWLQENKAFAIMDIGRGATKEEAIAQAEEWFKSMADDTTQDTRKSLE